MINESGAGFLLPMRIAGLNKLVQLIEESTKIVRPLSQPWMYFALLVLTVLLLVVDVGTIWTAIDLMKN